MRKYWDWPYEIITKPIMSMTSLDCRDTIVYAYTEERKERKGITGCVSWKVGSAAVYTGSSSSENLWSFGSEGCWTRPWRITAGIGDDDLLFFIGRDIGLVRDIRSGGEDLWPESFLCDGLLLSSVGLPISLLLTQYISLCQCWVTYRRIRVGNRRDTHRLKWHGWPFC